MIRVRNPAQIRQLITEMPHKDEASYAWGNVLGAFSILPALRGLWFGANRSILSALYDHSMQGMTLSQTNNPTFSFTGLMPYIHYTRASSQYHTRVDEAALDITGALTAFAWVRFSAGSTGVGTGVLGKYLSAGNQRSWMLYKTAGNVLAMVVSGDGIINPVNPISNIVYTVGQWYFMVGKFTPNTEGVLFVNGEFVRDSSGVPATIFNSTAPLNIGVYDTNYLDGDVAFAGMCADDLPDAYIRLMYDVSRRLFGL